MTGKIWKGLISVLLVAALLLAAVIYLPRVFGIEPLIVLSGSMEPEYHVGALVYVEKKEPQDMKKGDVMTFYLDEKTVVTHRIVSVDTKQQQFVTKGDANEQADGAPVAFANCMGSPILSVPKLGYVADFLGRVSGKILYITGIIVLLLLLYIGELLWPKKKGESEYEKG